RVGLHHQLEGDDLVSRPEEAHGLAVPGGVAHAQRAREVVLLDLLAVADRPHADDAGIREQGSEGRRKEKHREALHAASARRSIARTRPTRVSAAATSRVRAE